MSRIFTTPSSFFSTDLYRGQVTDLSDPLSLVVQMGDPVVKLGLVLVGQLDAIAGDTAGDVVAVQNDARRV